MIRVIRLSAIPNRTFNRDEFVDDVVSDDRSRLVVIEFPLFIGFKLSVVLYFRLGGPRKFRAHLGGPVAGQARSHAHRAAGLAGVRGLAEPRNKLFQI